MKDSEGRFGKVGAAGWTWNRGAERSAPLNAASLEMNGGILGSVVFHWDLGVNNVKDKGCRQP
jgi:hypothetical protein